MQGRAHCAEVVERYLDELVGPVTQEISRDLVVAGINPGANVGRSVYPSGTVGACTTARSGGISGVAVSQEVDSWGIEGDEKYRKGESDA